MDKLLAVTTGIGQPLRPEDWEFIQNKTKEALGAIVTGLMGHTAHVSSPDWSRQPGMEQ